MRTTTAHLSPKDLQPYFHNLDLSGLYYDFVVTDRNAYATVLELRVDGREHNGLHIKLKPDGTWELIASIPMGE